MNNRLKLKNSKSNVELIAFLQDKNFFDLFYDSNGFAISVEIIENDDKFAVEPVKQLLEKNIKKRY